MIDINFSTVISKLKRVSCKKSSEKGPGCCSLVQQGLCRISKRCSILHRKMYGHAFEKSFIWFLKCKNNHNSHPKIKFTIKVSKDDKTKHWYQGGIKASSHVSKEPILTAHISVMDIGFEHKHPCTRENEQAFRVLEKTNYPFSWRQGRLCWNTKRKGMFSVMGTTFPDMILSILKTYKSKSIILEG